MIEYLQSINVELGYEAGGASLQLAGGDPQLAQHIIQSAFSAPPVCRHLLAGGCYRSDCTFSHEVEEHTCLFWLRGVCAKVGDCAFYHGFAEGLKEGFERREEDEGYEYYGDEAGDGGRGVEERSNRWVDSVD